jgi:membrane protein YdbS with pleckstrin-like domain
MKRRMWIPLGASALAVVVPFILAVWLLFVTRQPIEVRLFGAFFLALAGLWNLWRAWTTYRRIRKPPPSN